VGSAVHAEKLRKLSPKLAVRTRFVGLDDTSRADARLAAWNCMNTKGVERTRAWDVKYATKGVPESTTGSLPTTKDRRRKRAYSDEKSLRPLVDARMATVKAR
jgi:hypothetical protein